MMNLKKTFSSLSFALLSTFLFNSISATTYVFIGKGAWTDASNWKGQLIPPSNLKAEDTVVINGNAIASSQNGQDDFASSDGSVAILAGGSLTLQNAIQFSNNSGSFVVFGTLTNKTNFVVYEKSSFSVYGSVINEATISNLGLLTVNGGSIMNSGKLDNTGQIIENCGSTISNTTTGTFNIGNSTLNCGTKILGSGTVSGSAKTGTSSAQLHSGHTSSSLQSKFAAAASQ